MREEQVRTRDVTLTVHLDGPDDGLPIVLLHGFPVGAVGTWRKTIPALTAAGHRVIAIDQRGYGASSRPSRMEDYAQGPLVDDVLAIADHYALPSFVLVGHDFGGAVSFATAQLHPSRVR